MNVDRYTCKITLLNSDSVCVIHSEWLSSNVKLLLIHDNQAWSGELQLTENEDLKELLDQLSLSREKYVEESRKALATYGGADDFAYTLENKKFTWKKKLVRKNSYFKFGNVNLSEVPLAEAFEKVMDNTLKLNMSLSTKLQDSDSQRNSFKEENNILKSKLKEVVEKKKQMEDTLYSQFLQLLNEKKRRIRELKKEMPAQANGVSEAMQEDESDHFDSDTEIDSEEENLFSVSKMPIKNDRVGIKSKSVTPPKKPRQEKQIESVAGPSGEHLRGKCSKITKPKKQSVKSKKDQNKMIQESFVIGRFNQVKDENLSESSEDVFKFKNSKVINDARKSVKQTTSRVKYDSDDETGSYIAATKQANCDVDRTLGDVEIDRTPSDIDIDRTPSDVDIDRTPSVFNQGGCLNGNADPKKREEMEKKTTADEKVKPLVKEQTKENTLLGEQKHVCGNSEITKTSSYKGLSSSTIDILNQLI